MLRVESRGRGVLGKGASGLRLVGERVVGNRLRRFRKGIWCYEKTREGDTRDFELREWG